MSLTESISTLIPFSLNSKVGFDKALDKLKTLTTTKSWRFVKSDRHRVERSHDFPFCSRAKKIDDHRLLPDDRHTTNELEMPDLTIVYWRDIPAQVRVGKGRRGTRVQLPERFERAIDRCAMRTGARDSDSYLQEWRRSEPRQVSGNPVQIADREARKLARKYSPEKIGQLVMNDGWESESG